MYVPQYFDGMDVVEKGKQQLDAEINKIDELTLSAIKENEKKYHDAVMRYLKKKEKDLRYLIGELANKESSRDDKDLVIEKLKTQISMLESDGGALIKRLTSTE